MDLQTLWQAGAIAARNQEGGKRVRRAEMEGHPPLAGPWAAPEFAARGTRQAIGLSALAGAVLGKPLDKVGRCKLTLRSLKASDFKV